MRVLTICCPWRRSSSKVAAPTVSVSCKFFWIRKTDSFVLSWRSDASCNFCKFACLRSIVIFWICYAKRRLAILNELVMTAEWIEFWLWKLFLPWIILPKTRFYSDKRFWGRSVHKPRSCLILHYLQWTLYFSSGLCKYKRIPTCLREDVAHGGK